MSKLKKKFKRTNLKRFASVFMAFVMLAAAVGVIEMVQVRADSYNKKEDIPTVVEFNDKYYTKDNPYVIVEVVPYYSYGSFGYWVGGDSMAVKESDLAKLYAVCSSTEKEDMRKALSESCSQIFNGQSYDGSIKVPGHSWTGDFICTANGGLQNFEDRNVLAHMIFGDSDDTNLQTSFSDMTDKLVVKTVVDTELTYDDVANADFVYFNHIDSAGNAKNAYNKMAELCAKYNLTTASGLSRNYVKETYTRTAMNINPSVAFYTYIRNNFDSMAVAFDWAGMDGGDVTNGYTQLGFMEMGIKSEVLIDEYMTENLLNDKVQNKAGKFSYKGSFGSVDVDPATGIVFKDASGTPITWRSIMFGAAHGQNDPQAPYYNATGTHGSEYVHNNFFTYNGTPALSQALKNQQSGGNPNGSDFPVVADIFGIDEGKTNVTYRDLLQYIMGLYSYNTYMSEVNVIEIQPWGRYEFNNAKGADKVLRTFGILGDYNVVSQSYDRGTNTGVYVLNKKSKDFTVKIRSLSVNAFNGLNEDLKSNVDLIIIGTYNQGNYIVKDGEAVISSDGHAVNFKAAGGTKHYSGNDFTDKAYERLYEYVKAGLPLLEMPEVYNADSTIDRTKSDGSDSNIYKMSRLKLNARLNGEGKASSNITTVADDSTDDLFITKKVLEYPARPEFTIVSPAAYDYDTNRTPLTPDGVSFTIRADNNIPAGSHVKLYIDRNADALYNEMPSSDMRELFADYDIPVALAPGDTYTIDLGGSLPSKWFGYFKFKIEVTRSGFSRIQESSFALKAQEKRTVKVLQIYNATTEQDYNGKYGDDNLSVVTMSLKSDTFKSSFQTASAVTGMNLDVTIMKVVEFEDKIKSEKDYLKDFSIVVVGFRDSFGMEGAPFKEQAAIDALNEYIDEGHSVLFTHDTMAYRSVGQSSSASKYIEPIMTKELSQPIGMKGAGIYTNSLLSARTKYTIYGDVSGNTSTKNTTKINKLNWGQMTEYPYKIDDTIDVITTHGQFYQLNLEEIPTKDYDGNVIDGVHDSEVTVWYTLGADSGSNNKYFTNCGQDAINNYYIYSKGNVTYTSAGHRAITSDGPEMQLFVNTLVRSIIVATMPPEVEITNGMKTDGNNYDIIARTLKTDVNGVVSNDNTIPLHFIATDEDLASGDNFAKAIIFVDENYNGSYDDGELILKDYGSSLQNEVEYKEDLYELANSKGTAALNQVLSLYTTNTLKVGILVTDTSKASGQAFGMYIRRNYFELD